jgi:polar amino acid transport system substrate-binding protein
MGIEEVDGVLTEFGSLIPGLQAGRFDIIAAGMFITPKRCAEINFSEPSYGIGQAMLVKKGNPKGIQDYSSIKANPDLKLAVMAGAVEVGYVTALSIADMAKKGEGVESTKPFGEVAGKSVKGHGGFGFRKEDTDLLQAFNAELKTFLGSPEHIALVEPLGFGADYLPNKTTEELCAGK